MENVTEKVAPAAVPSSDADSSASTSTAPSKKNKIFWVWPSLCWCIPLLVLVGGAHGESWWLLGLFLMPILAQAFGLAFLHDKVNPFFYRFYLGTTTICVGGYCVALAGYNYWKPEPNQAEFHGWGLLLTGALFAIVILLALVVLMTFAIMKSPTDDNQADKWRLRFDDLAGGVSAHPFFGMLLFFTLFLGVAYLFGFAFAFEDRRALSLDKTKPALHMVNADSLDGAESSESIAKSKSGGSESPVGDAYLLRVPEDPNAAKPSPDAYSYRFYFNTKAASVDIEKCNCGADRSSTAPQPTSYSVTKPGQFNYCSLTSLVAKLKIETEAGRHVRVLMIGHSDNEPVGSHSPNYKPNSELPDYKSNYELSQARLENVRYQVLGGLKDSTTWHNVEFLWLPVSSEPALGVLDPTIKQENRVVVATLETVPDHLTTRQAKMSRSRTPRLMDYVYFAIYTITTTGYGDIIPTTDSAKFLCSLANVVEVFFLVVFVNALVALRKQADPLVNLEQIVTKTLEMLTKPSNRATPNKS